jgi:cell wall-associated NlpC family hydrolase
MSITPERLTPRPAATDSLGMRTTDGWKIVAVLSLGVVAGGCATAGGALRPSPFPGTVSRSTLSPTVVPPGVVIQALALQGTPYRLGGEEPRTGLDCSGLVRYVFRAEGIQVPRTVAEQFTAGTPVETADLKPGDLIFFDTSGPGPSHVGIAIDADSFVHAPGSGGVVRIDRLGTRYWQERLRGIKRIVALEEDAQGTTSNPR